MTDLRKARRRISLADTSRGDRLPPHSLEAEQGVLGCVLLSPVDCLGECVRTFKDGPEVFYDLRHQNIYKVLVEMSEQGEPIDLITLQQRLRDRQQLEAVGGIGYLSSLPDAVPSAANLGYYGDIVGEKHTLRKMIQVCTETVAKAYDQEGDVDLLLDEAERDILSVRSRSREGMVGMREATSDAITMIEQMVLKPGEIAGLSTGLVDLDALTDGLAPGDLVVLCGRPSDGKSALAGTIVRHVAIELGLGCGIFSREMSPKSWALRMLCADAKVNSRDLRDSYVAERDFPKLVASSGRVSKAPVQIIKRAQTTGEIRSWSRLLVQGGAKLLVADYLQRFSAPEVRKKDNREKEIDAIAQACKDVAEELGVPFLLLSQVNADGQTRESAAPEQHADGIWKFRQRDKKEEASESGEVVLDVEKSRNGPTGSVRLVFLKKYTRFENAAKISQGDTED